MEGLKRELKMLETVELQILGALHKIKGARCNLDISFRDI